MFPSLLLLATFASAKVHDIQVGKGGLTFSPEAISADAGDQVVFHFVAKNHTATRSSFAAPCSLADGGFDSGFMPVSANQTDNFPTYTITVNDTAPIWVFCEQAANTPNSHCGAGMVFAVNCGQTGAANSFDNFKQSALAIGASLKAGSTADGSTTAAYGDVTIPAAPTATPVTQTISLSTQVWTTTYNSYPGSPAATPASLEGQVHKVVVGGTAGFVFDPPQVTALPRDTIVFEFHAKNHSVVQSTFADPCRPFDVNGTVGFTSGFQFVAQDATEFPTWNLTVNDTNPIWAYCGQTVPSSHCGQGMVFAVNSPETSARNFTAFQNLAKTLNGTTTSNGTSTSSSPSPTNTNSGSAKTYASVGSLSLALAVSAMLL